MNSNAFINKLLAEPISGSDIERLSFAAIDVIAKDMGARGVPPACSEECGRNVRVPGEAEDFAITAIDAESEKILRSVNGKLSAG